MSQRYRIVGSAAMTFPEWFLLQAYLYAYSLLRGVIFEVLPLHSCALSSTMLPLLETFLEFLLWNSFQWHRHIFCMSSVSWNLHPFKADFSLETSESRVSSPVIIFDRILLLNWFERSAHTSTRRCFCSSVNSRGAAFTETFLMTKFSSATCLAVCKFSYTAMGLILKRPSECVRFRTFSTFPSVLRDLGRLLSSSSTFFRPSLSRLYHSETPDFFIAFPPYVSESTAQVSLAFFPNFTQNVMLIRFSKNRSLIFATRRRKTRFISTATSTQPALMRWNRNWCNLKHAQTCLY